MSLPYHWRPMGVRYAQKPEPGMLMPRDHRVWRIIDVSQRMLGGEDEATTVLVLRPAEITSDDPRARDHDRHIRLGRFAHVDVYPTEHYPVCAACDEPLPCREQMTERVSAEVIAKMKRFEVWGVCPACSEVITGRQQSYRFHTNLHVFDGPPVTFHLRSRCFSSVISYERELIAADPAYPRHWTCSGHLTNHNDRTYDCTESAACPGAQAAHPSYTVCSCPDCHSRGSFGCTPTPGSVRNERDRS